MACTLKNIVFQYCRSKVDSVLIYIEDLSYLDLHLKIAIFMLYMFKIMFSNLSFVLAILIRFSSDVSKKSFKLSIRMCLKIWLVSLFAVDKCWHNSDQSGTWEKSYFKVLSCNYLFVHLFRNSRRLTWIVWRTEWWFCLIETDHMYVYTYV